MDANSVSHDSGRQKVFFLLSLLGAKPSLLDHGSSTFGERSVKDSLKGHERERDRERQGESERERTFLQSSSSARATRKR